MKATAQTAKVEDVKPGMAIKSAGRWYKVVSIERVTDWAITFIVNDSAGNPAGYLSAYRDGSDYPVKEG